MKLSLNRIALLSFTFLTSSVLQAAEIECSLYFNDQTEIIVKKTDLVDLGDFTKDGKFKKLWHSDGLTLSAQSYLVEGNGNRIVKFFVFEGNVSLAGSGSILKVGETSDVGFLTIPYATPVTGISTTTGNTTSISPLFLTVSCEVNE